MSYVWRRNPKVDENQAEIVDALRAAGASVTLLGRVGGGCPDLLVGFQRLAYLLEVKAPGEKRKANQIDWANKWRGPKVREVHTIEEALHVVTGKRC